MRIEKHDILDICFPDLNASYKIEAIISPSISEYPKSHSMFSGNIGFSLLTDESAEKKFEEKCRLFKEGVFAQNWEINFMSEQDKLQHENLRDSRFSSSCIAFLMWWHGLSGNVTRTLNLPF